MVNGGTDKGQADGFLLDSISKVMVLKGSNGESAITYICKKVREKDEDAA